MRDRAFIAFVLSHACPLKCDFCCSIREVVGQGRIRRGMIEDCMIRFAAEPAVERFTFTGGEPFLWLGDIKAAVASARKAGVSQPIHFVTACHWAKDSASVRETLADLKDLGLEHLGLSYDRQHSKWVAPEQIEMVCDAARDLGIGVRITGTFWDVGDKVEDLIPAIASRPEVDTANYLVMDEGRARTSASWPRAYRIPVEDKYSCGRPGAYSLSIYPDGEVYPCCAGGLQIEGKLSCGNVHRDSAAHILFAAMTDFHVRMVKEYGWGVLYALVESMAPDLIEHLPDMEKADSVCTICRDLNLDLKDRLAPVYSEIEKEYARTRAEHEWQARIAADGWDGPRLIDGRLLDWPGLEQLILDDRALRLDYLAGAAPIGPRPTEAAAFAGAATA
jgi:MoaA/NifB/PqqE/SkfB family radical SAM enzyme